MNVLSLFDGISCARVALGYANIKVKEYYACEIEKNAILISKKNYPDIKQLGSVIDFKREMINGEIDLLIGGSPCQDLSIAKKDRKGLEGERSSLFWDYVRIKNELKPKYFILENVASMPNEARDIISEAMGCKPILFNASLVSAQTRKRYFWTNIGFELPDDRDIILKDILQPPGEVDERMVNKDKKSYTLTATYNGATIKNSIERKQRTMVKIGTMGKNYNQGNSVYSPEGKSCALSANGGGLGANTGLYLVDTIRKLTPIECERLQSLPDNYTEGIANTNRYKVLGNAFNANVVAHILSYI
tara:strand:+ start:5818 stop:6729 length:912 start_codon:yes stop_codon:yes gene_type:complete